MYTVQTGGHNNPVILHTYSNKKNRKGKEGREGREKKGFPQLLASNIYCRPHNGESKAREDHSPSICYTEHPQGTEPQDFQYLVFRKA